MGKLGPYEVHPFAEAFPLIEGDEFDELVLDIKRNGLREPITLNSSKTVLIDGRNRYRACVTAGVDPIFEALGARYTEEMISDLIVSKNIQRRHLDTADRLAAMQRYGEYIAQVREAAEERRREAAARANAERARAAEASGADSPSTPVTERNEAVCAPVRTPPPARSANEIGRKFGVSGRTVQQYERIRRDAPDLVPKIHDKSISVKQADAAARQRVRDQPKPEVVKPSPVMLALRTHTGDEVSYPKPQAKATFNETPGEGISWAAWSWNPVTGCMHGCEYCYARDIATSDRFKASYPVGFTPLFHHERLSAPANTVIPAAHRDDPAWRRVFVCSMADLYGRWVPDEWIEDVHTAMLTDPQWQYITLTKFPDRYAGLQMPPGAWVGTSVDEQKRVRIAERAFREIDDVSVKWLSLEPLREPLEFTDLSMFDWVVIGAQTETRQPTGAVSAFAPPFEWVARLVLQAKEAGCKVHLKPNLLGRTDPKHPGMQLLNEFPEVSHSPDPASLFDSAEEMMM